MKPGIERSGELLVTVNIDVAAIGSTDTTPASRAQPTPFGEGRDDPFLDTTNESEVESVSPLRSKPRQLISRLDQLSLLIVTMTLTAGMLLNLILGDSAAEPPPELTAYRVDLNTAGLEELVLLEGIGELTAEKIILDRQETGSFSAEDDLQRVKGIGPKTMDRLRDHIVCR